MSETSMEEATARMSEWAWWSRWAETWWTVGQAHADSVLGADSHPRRLDEHYLERSGWAAGVWDREPDRAEWRYRGYVCLMMRAPSTGAWCGYVGVPPGHPWHALPYDDPDVRVHGGLTYSGYCNPVTCGTTLPGEHPHPWFFGFDCAHFQDRMPAMEATTRDLGLPLRPDHDVFNTYRDEGYVVAQVERLAEQAAEAAHGVTPIGKAR